MQIKPAKQVKFLNQTQNTSIGGGSRQQQLREKQLHQSYDTPQSLGTDWNGNTQVKWLGSLKRDINGPGFTLRNPVKFKRKMKKAIYN